MVVSLVCTSIESPWIFCNNKNINSYLHIVKSWEFYFEFNDDETCYDFYKTWMNLGQGFDKNWMGLGFQMYTNVFLMLFTIMRFASDEVCVEIEQTIVIEDGTLVYIVKTI